MNTGEKAGVPADKDAIIAAYGEAAQQQFNAIGQSLFGKMVAFRMDPQTIADGILNLIRMPQGTRPLRLPLDAIAQGTDVAFINARAELKEKWLAAYN